MKTITVKQPWASLIVEPDTDNLGFGIKPIENRSWPCPKKYIGKRVLVHAGMNNLLKKATAPSIFTSEQMKTFQKSFAAFIAVFGPNVPTGAIIGSVEIVDCVINHSSIWAEKTNISTSWGEHLPIIIDKKPTYNWVLANPIKFPEPIPAKGKLSFWEFDEKWINFAK